jgi:glycosyltransferase involved in cell wall biosynthesis
MTFFYWVDYTSHYGSNTGVQRVTRGLARAWQELAPGELVFVCWDSISEAMVPATADQRRNLARFDGPRSEEEPYHQELICGPDDWLLIPEVTHITPHSSPPTAAAIGWARSHGLRVAALFYDAIPLKLDEYASGREIHRTYMGDIYAADLIIPISQLAGQDYVKLAPTIVPVGLKPPAIAPVPLAGEIPSAPRETLGAYPQDETTILCVGSLEPRKNQLTLMEAFDRVTSRNPELNLRLLFVGHLSPLVAPGLASYCARNSRIEYRGYLDDQQLTHLYRGAYFTVFASLEEGFGLPILESLWHGRVSICHNDGAMAEVAAGGGCLTVDCAQPEALASAISLLIHDHRTHRRLQREALARPIKSWQEYAAQIRALLGEHAGNSANARVTVCVEHTRQHPANSGIQRVTRGLVRALQQCSSEVTPVKWDPARGACVVLDEPELAHLARWNGPSVLPSPNASPASQGGWFIQPEVYYYPGAPDFDLVLDWARGRGLRTAVLFYDVIPWKLSRFYPEAATNAHRDYMLHLRHFDVILTISVHSATELLHFYEQQNVLDGELRRKIQVCSLPGEFLETPRALVAGQPDSDAIRIVSVGTVEPRKNHLALLEAFQLVSDRHPGLDLRLKLIGGAPYPELAAQVEAHVARNPRIEWIKTASDTVVAEAYQESNFSIYPSLEEGFGLPILESLWRGVPCICRNTGATLEVAVGGGCLTVDTSNIPELARALEGLSLNSVARSELANEALLRPLRTWNDYARDVLAALKKADQPSRPASPPAHPRLSICISTYNRSSRLALSLARVVVEASAHRDTVEVLVVDNASTDDTQAVAESFAREFPVRYHRNPKNVGMLGNLEVTARLAAGDFVWIIGDDDLIHKGGVDRVIRAIRQQPDAELVYLNYSYHNEEMRPDWGFSERLLQRAEPIDPGLSDRFDCTARDISPLTENCFTAIYTCVFRRAHAIAAYSQNTAGAPFSTLLTCVPTSHYICEQMFDLPAVFLAEPVLAVSLHCSWLRWACLFILERFPELFQLMLDRGADLDRVNALRLKAVSNVMHHLRIVYDQESVVREHFSMDRFIRRHRALDFYAPHWAEIVEIYSKAWSARKVLGDHIGPDELRAKHHL